jgi:dipeptidyl aminopeptidase/acylaminoacyl peptidase
MAADCESPPVRLAESRHFQWASSWSRDGRFLAYWEQVSGSSRVETYVLPLDGRTVPQRWGAGADYHATYPSFSPDGRWLAYQSADEPGKADVNVAPFPGPGSRQRISGRDGGFAPVWSSDGQEIYYVERLKDTRIIGRHLESVSPLRLAAPRVAFALPFALSNPDASLSRAFVIAPDGRRVLVVQADQQVSKDDVNIFEVIRNWSEEVKAKLAGK